MEEDKRIEKDKDWKFYKLARVILEEYDNNWKTTVNGKHTPIREVDRFAKKIVDIYEVIDKLTKETYTQDKEIEFWQKKADEQLHKNRDKDKEIWKLKNKIKKLGKDIDKLTLGG